MANQPSEYYKNLVDSFINDVEKKFPKFNQVEQVQNLDPAKWANGEQGFVLKEQKELTQEDVRHAIIYAKKEIIEIRNSMRKLMKELRELPTYQFIKPQVDKLISSIDDLEALLLNRFDEKQIKSQAPAEWESLQRLRTFFIQQLLERYKK